MVKLLKKGKGIQRIPMDGLRMLQQSGKAYKKATGQGFKELKEINKEIRRRKRK